MLPVQHVERMGQDEALSRYLEEWCMAVPGWWSDLSG